MGRIRRDWVLATIMAAGLRNQPQAMSGHDGPLATFHRNHEFAESALALKSEGSGQSGPLPEPLTAAIMMLGWRGDDVPRIEVVAAKPPDGAATVEAWVRFDVDGSAMPIVYVRTDTEVYRDAARHDYQALVRLAGVLAHERWHLRHGRDEIGAYTAQLSTMVYLHANSTRLGEVRQALEQVRHHAKDRPPQP